MRLHRFFIAPDEQELTHELWLKSPELRKQWFKVFRYKVGDDVVLFDGLQTERLYKIARVEPDAAQLVLVTEFERKLPHKHVYLFWSLLKKDKNEWVVQKCTELGVSNFVPVIAERSEKTGFNIERAEKIAIEAAEQCGRSDIPHLREPLQLQEALHEYKNKIDLFFANETNSESINDNGEKPIGIFIGPEGGWANDELELFRQHKVGSVHLGSLTLRAETAAVVVAVKLLTNLGSNL